MSFSRSLRTAAVLSGAFALALVVAHPVWMGALGGYLVKAETPFKADIAIVLAGDYSGNRISKAADLVRQGFVPKVLVSGPTGFYGHAESDLAIPYAVRKGYPAEWFIPLRLDANSTSEEAEIIVHELRRRNVHRFLVVTSDYHTRRAAVAYRRLAGGMEFRVVAAPDQYFHAGGWWKSRPGRKQFAFEWMKTFATWVGL